MTFADPSKLWFLLLVPVLIGAYVFLQARRRKYTMRFTNLAMLDKVAPRRPAWRRHVALICTVVTVGLLITAFAEPQRTVRVPRERATIILTIDVSLSMKADDVQPNRLVAAQRAARAFVRDLPPKYNVALATFSGKASLLVSPTKDRAPVMRAIDNLRLAPSTAIGEGIFISLEALRQVPPDPERPKEKPPARIALMTDGYQNTGRSVDSGVAAAKKAKVPIHTIAFGTADGMVTLEGQQTPVPVDEETMRKIATDTGGKSYAPKSAEGLQQVYEDIASSIGYFNEKQKVTTQWIGYALIAALCAAAVSLLFLGRLP